MQYKGIELEGTDKKVAQSHSRFLEKDEGTAWIDRLLATDKGVLDRAQFHEASALSSVLNLNYQVCNGGVSQYFLNGYDEYRKPCHEQDVEQLDIHEQVKMLERLHVFGCEVFPNRTDENQTVAKVAKRLGTVKSDYESCREHYQNYCDDEDYYYCDEEAARVYDDFDNLYYAVNRYIETLCETYAQYLCKSYGIA